MIEFLFFINPNIHCYGLQFAKGKEEAPYPQEAIDEVRNEWAEFVRLQLET